jgi:nitrate reductase gamma subunit
MLSYLQKAKQYLWAFVEIGFLTVLSIILIYLILGPQSSGVFVSGVADNVLKFAAAVPAQSLIGLAIVLALVLLIANRMR